MAFWFLSKNLGHGLRVGVGTRVESKTQRVNERERFISTVRADIEHLLDVYWLHSGVVAAPADIDPANVPDPAGVASLYTELRNLNRVLDDGGTLTAKRKDQMLAFKHQLEDTISQMDKSRSVLDLFKRYTARLSWVRSCWVVSALFVPPALLLPKCWIFLATTLSISAMCFWSAAMTRKALKARAIYFSPNF